MFGDVVHVMLSHVLVLKKGTTTADRVIKFIGAYTRFINEKGECLRSPCLTFKFKRPFLAAEDSTEEGDSTAARFTARLLKFLLKGIEAKDKNVRYRVLQTLVEMVSHLGEIE